jgi:hypothetical protein
VPPSKELRGGVFFVNDIPRSASGKILRKTLRAHWDRERSGNKAVVDGEFVRVHIHRLVTHESPDPTHDLGFAGG